MSPNNDYVFLVVVAFCRFRTKHVKCHIRSYMDDEKAAEDLETTGNYRVLRRLIPRSHYYRPDGTETKLAIFLDLETTGLDPDNDEIIELAMVPFRYSNVGRIFEVLDPFNELREPRSGPIPPEITKITGITNEMVKGHQISATEVSR